MKYIKLFSQSRNSCGISLLIAATFLALTLFPEVSFAASEEASIDRMKETVSYLAADEREGRGIGTAGLDSSATFISWQFEQMGLAPLFDGNYFQEFTTNWGAEILEESWLVSVTDTIPVGTSFMPTGFSSDGVVRAPVTFAGYGITAAEYNYDDYAEADISGQIVLVLDGEPASKDPDSRFEGTYNTDHSLLRTKATNAKVHGAAGLLIVQRFIDDEEEVPLTPPRTDEPYVAAGIPVAFVSREIVSRLFPRFSLDLAQRSIDANQAPRSMPASADTIEYTVHMKRNDVIVKNVGAKLAGGDEVIVIGAHYDHLGFGQSGSLDPEQNVVHNGADDNASGTTLLIEIARSLKENPPGTTFHFVAFAAEEIGLAGSARYVQDAPVDLGNIRFMLNLDMVGRMRDDKLTVYGVGSAEELQDLATAAGEGMDLDLAMTGGGFGSSDQTSFYAARIPVIHLFTSLHSDYHTSRDDVELINFSGMISIKNYSLNLLNEVSRYSEPLTYTQQEKPDSGGGRRGLPVSMGTVPDFGSPDSLRGFRIQGVRPDTPAEHAGLQAMDVLMRMGDVVIDNIYDFTFALKRHIPGDTVVVEFSRDGVVDTTRVILAAPKGRKGGGHPGGMPGGGK